jgi:N-acylneuraminate cytidylyltransferase
MHALAWLLQHENWAPDLVVNLRPTSPLRRPSHVDAAIELLLDTGADSVKAVCLARQHPHKMWLRQRDGSIEPFLKTPFRLEHGPDVPRARLEDVYWQNGVVDVTRHEVILEQRVMIGRRVAGLVTDPADSIDIDTPMDLQLAELLLAQRAATAR